MDDDVLEEIDKKKGDFFTRSGYVNMILRENLLK